MGTLQGLYAIGSIAGPYTMGLVMDAHPDAAKRYGTGFTITGVLVVVGGMCAVLLVQSSADRHRLAADTTITRPKPAIRLSPPSRSGRLGAGRWQTSTSSWWEVAPPGSPWRPSWPWPASRVTVLERRTEPVQSRAGTVLPRVLELLDGRAASPARFLDRAKTDQGQPAELLAHLGRNAAGALGGT